MNQTTDQDAAHFISEHYDLLKWVFRICNLMSKKTIEYYRDEAAAYAGLIAALNDKNLVGDYEATKKALKGQLMKLEITGGVVDIKDPLGDENFKAGFSQCPLAHLGGR